MGFGRCVLFRRAPGDFLAGLSLLKIADHVESPLAARVSYDNVEASASHQRRRSRDMGACGDKQDLGQMVSRRRSRDFGEAGTGGPRRNLARRS